MFYVVHLNSKITKHLQPVHQNDVKYFGGFFKHKITSLK